MPRQSTKPPLSQEHRRIGKAIRQTRLNAGWTQENLADRAKLNATQIGNIERGQSNFTSRTLLAIGKALPISLGELFTLADEFRPKPRNKRSPSSRP
jgi:transcriptional regulator with XRE-family HTH domain